MNASTQLMTMNGLGILPFKNKENVWTVRSKDVSKTFSNISDAMDFAKGLVK
jgi:hypothetical protein